MVVVVRLIFRCYRQGELVARRLRISDAAHLRAHVQLHLCCDHENVSGDVLHRRRLYDHAGGRRVFVSPSGSGAPLEASDKRPSFFMRFTRYPRDTEYYENVTCVL